MRKSPLSFLLWGTLLLLGGVAQAQLMDVDISAARQRLDQNTARDGHGAPVTVTTTDVAYNVTVQNKTFKPITDLQVKYMIFYKDPKPGMTAKAVDLSEQGMEPIPLLEASRTTTFTTKTMKLTSEALDGGYYYTQGGNNNTKDRIVGVWFRAYAGGKMIGEYANPTTMTKRDWKEPATPSSGGQ